MGHTQLNFGTPRRHRLRNRISDSELMRIVIEGPKQSEVDFSETLEVFKEKNLKAVNSGGWDPVPPPLQ